MNALVTPPRTIAWTRWAFIGLFAAGMVAAFILLPVREWIASLVDTLRAMGGAGLALYALTYTVVLVVTGPSSVMSIAAGYAWGVGGGFAIALPSLTVGALAAFLVGRHLLRDRVAPRVARSPRMSAIDRAVAEQGGRVVFLLRLTPVVPFNYSNYAFSVTRVSTRSFVLATVFGMIPPTLLYTWLGSTLPALTGDAAASGGSSTARTVMLVTTIVVTAAVTWLVARFARRALARAAA